MSEAVDGLDFLKMMGCALPAKKSFLHDPVDFKEALFDVILMDDNMPNLSGSEAVEIVRKLGYKGLIIGITGDVDPSSVINFKKKGVDEVLSKPIDIENLKRVIGKILVG